MTSPFRPAKKKIMNGPGNESRKNGHPNVIMISQRDPRNTSCSCTYRNHRPKSSMIKPTLQPYITSTISTLERNLSQVSPRDFVTKSSNYFPQWFTGGSNFLPNFGETTRYEGVIIITKCNRRRPKTRRKRLIFDQRKRAITPETPHTIAPVCLIAMHEHCE